MILLIGFNLSEISLITNCYSTNKENGLWTNLFRYTEKIGLVICLVLYSSWKNDVFDPRPKTPSALLVTNSDGTFVISINEYAFSFEWAPICKSKEH